MKKVLLFLLTIMLGLGSWQVSAQQTVEIGTGTSTTYYGPYNSLWGYSFVEQIYTAEEIDMTGTITSISFNNNSSGQTNNITVYMKLVNRSSFSSNSDYETVTAADIVYTGSHNFATGWSEITLDVPFDYDGASNLLIAIHEYTSGYSTQYFYYTSTTDSRLISFHSDSADPDPYNLGSYSGSIYTQTYRNNIRMEIMPSGNTCYTPLTPVVSGVSAYEATLSWTPRENQTAWEVFCGSGVTDLDQVSWTPVTDTFYTFTNLTPATNYTAYVRTVCGAEVSNVRQVPFTTDATCASVPSNVTVGGITATTAEVSWTADAADNAWEVVVVPSNMAPETGTPEQTSSYPYTLTNLQDNTQYKVYVRTDCGGGDHSYWSNPATFTTLPFCSAPLNVTVSQITANSALVSWQPAVYGAASYTVGYTLASEGNWIDVQVDGTQFMLSNLDPDSTYDVQVYSNCPVGEGDTIHKIFTTKHCLVGGDIAIGEGTTTNYYIPVNNYYNYTYSQQIFLASEMSGPTTINSVSFYYSYSSPSTDKTNVTIYLGHTTKSEFSGTSDYIQPTGLQQVYTGNLNCQQGWNTFTFTTPFQYNGTDNLVLAVDDNSGDYNGSSYTFYVHSTSGSYRSLYYYSDSNNPDPSNPTSGSPNSSRSTNRNNVIFGGNCDNDATCVRPNVYVTETSTYSVTLDWAPGYSENTWEVEYSADDVTWTSSGTTNIHPYEVSGLNSDTRYYFRVRSNCGSDVSEWSGASARTECGPITQLPYTNSFDEVISDNGTYFVTCWSRYTTNPDRVVRCYNSATHSGSYALDFNYSPSCTTAAVTPMLDPSIPLNTVMLDFWAYSSLGQGWMEVGTMSDPNDFTTYEFYDTVRLSAPSTWENLIIDFSNYTGTNQYIAFLEINGTTTSYIFDDFIINYATNCLHPTNLAVDALTSTTVTLSWAEAGSATAWEIEYGPVGFTPGTGTTVSASTNPFTVDNLTPATTYDFYVYANCGSELSTPYGPVQATPGQYTFGVTGSDTLTTCGVILYDDGGANGDYSSYGDFTLVLYPENPNAVMALIGTSSTESCCDYLRVYDGVGTSGQQLAEYKGENLTVNVMSQSGPLTLVFHSDLSVVKSGFAITASCVTCYPPTNITASNSTLDGATLTWHGTGDSYVLFLNGDLTTGYDANDTTYTFSGLNASSSYSVQVASICNGDTSMLSSAATFSTACGAITITADEPWTEDFESYQGGGAQPFVCWATPVTQVVDNGTSPFVYCGYSQACHSGQNSAEMKGTSNMLALPEFTNDIADLRLSFWATTTSTSSPGSVDVGYMTDITDPTTFVALADAGTPGPRGNSGSSAGNGNYMGPFDFNGVTATGARIALRFNGASGLSWNLDDFTVELTPGCPSPVKTSVQVTYVDGHNATITWVDNDPSHTAWTVYYKATSDNDWSTMPANDTTVTLTGLDPQTAYDVYVITNCGTPETNPDATHTIHFTTTVACPAPTNVTVSNIGMTSATVSWASMANNFTIECDGATYYSTSTSYDLTGLTSGTSYTVTITADCGGDDGTSAPATISFNTALCEVADQCDYIFNLTDSYGDGWNGASITVQQNGITVANVGFTSGSSATVNVTLCDGQSTTLIWNTGSYDSECSFEVVSSYGDVIYTATNVSAGTLTTFISNCTPPTCPKPTLLEVTNVTATSVTLDWQVNGSETAWEVVYGTPGFDPSTATNVENANAHPYTVQNLTDATSYEFYVRAVCAVDDQSDWSAPVSATTPCGGALTVPYTQDFEGYSGTTYTDNNGIAPACWTTYSANTTYGAPHIISSGSYHYAASGNSMVFTCSSAGSDAYAALPTFTDPLNTLKLNFWRAMESTTQGTLTVGYVTDLNDLANTFVPVDTIPSVGSTSGDTISVNFNEAGIPANGNICFHWNKDNTYYSCCIDNVAVTLAGSGPGPVITDPTVTTTAATAIAQTTATLNGTITNPDNVTITAKGFEWKATAGGTYAPVTVTGNNLTYNLTGLTANTGYTYKAFITFNGTTVYGNEVTFTTLPDDVQPCNVPTGLHTTTIENEAIAIAWDANPDVTSWNIQYRPVGGTLASATSTTNSYNITGLTGLTTYEIQVQADCGNGNVSDWCTAISAQTTNVGIENYLLNSISLYPNPAKEYIDVRVDELNVTNMEVYDVYGKLINTVNVIDNPTRINVSNLAAGMYFVRVTTEQGVATKSFVKK